MARECLSNENIDGGDIAAMDGLTQLTLSYWFKRNAAGKQANVTKYTSATNRIYVQGFTDGKIYCSVSNGASSRLSFTLNDDQWHHLIMTYDGGGATNADKVQIYTDGTLQSVSFDAPAWPATGPSNSASFKVGSFFSSNSI